MSAAAQPAWLNQVYCEDALEGLARIPDGSIDLILTDPPYNLGKDYGNKSDQMEVQAYLDWTERWVDMALPKLKPNGSLYIFLTWRFSPEIFVMLKQRMTMLNEIIWDRRVPSMGGSVRSYTSVHDTIGFFAKRKDYYFDLDSIRIPYDEETKKARSRSIFVGAKWLEMGYNPKDLWSVSRLHREHPERADHPTQKPLEIVERMVKASCPPGGVVLDPFLGSGTTAVAAKRCERNFVGFELNQEYCDITNARLHGVDHPHQPYVAPKVKRKTALDGPADSAQNSPADGAAPDADGTVKKRRGRPPKNKVETDSPAPAAPRDDLQAALF